ncbi:MarR family winged helix-turn-helix transcriptional regulator [Pseudoruegeria sp. SHC-113]|uniref:MarR family winged helix-turn-helix transcriptional regulator n=1 Tax=Pseudoruegeria sp. SHC-113 TaxID=2855439 RepID=UPI0021BAE509|nr:MarR family transcriptional regulator [Pseudoruegeria sp. SHC-113]MCT8160195.1 MarR family transcriptional regulator [Pseudoruegeria sp. SHC-113]
MTHHGPNPTAQELRSLIERIARVMASEEWAEDLNPAQSAALGYLARANRFSRKPSVVAEYLGTTRGTASQTLKALDRKGLVAEEADPSDRRSISYSVTPKGQEMLARQRGFDAAVSALPEPAAQALGEALAALARSMLEAREMRGFGLCATCRHHETTAAGPRCGLLNVALSAQDASEICVDHSAR